MESRLDATKVLGFSAVDQALFSKIDIKSAGRLQRNLPDDVIQEKIQQARSSAAEHVMSSRNLYATLNFLLQHTLSESEALARLWIDSVLFRVTAMIEGSKRLIIGGEVFAADEIVATEPPKVSIGGHNDYVLFFVDEGIASGILGEKNFARALGATSEPLDVQGLFVAEAKGQNEDLVDHTPQVMVEMQACAKRLKSRHIRGTITNGRAWIFLLLELNDNFVGGRYWASQRYEIKTNYTDYDTTDFVIEHSVDMIVAILAHWVSHCAESLAEDDWFKAVSRQY